MLWEFDQEIRDLVHDQDVTSGGQIHKYTMHILELEKKDLKQVYVAYKSFLRIFQEEFPDPGAAIKNASPAVVFQVLQALHNLHDANSSITSKKAIDYYDQLINELKTKTQEFLKGISSVDEAAQKYKIQEDDSWVLFEMLSFNITDNPEKKPADQAFVDFIMAIYKKLGVSYEQILKNRKLRAQNAQGVVDGQNNHHGSVSAKMNKNKNKQIQAQSSENLKPKNDLVTAILDLNPGISTVTNKEWQDFFLALCETTKKFMPYQNARMESYDLLTHAENDVAFNKMIKDGIDFIEANNLVDKAMLSLIIAKFNDDCIKLKKAPIVIQMSEVHKTFQDSTVALWTNRNRSAKTREHFCNDIFPPNYLTALTPKQRYDIRMKFEEVTEKFIAIPDRAALIKFCANRIGPEKDPSLVIKSLPQQSVLVPPGTENKPWGKFIEKVYSIFEKPNALWDPNVNENEKLIRLQPLLEQFKLDFPTEAERAQAQRFFISFINSADCKFATNAKDYAWLFMEEMIPQSTTALLSQREEIRKLKKKVEQENETYKQAEILINSFNK